MYIIETSIEIAAPAGRVWEILSNTEAYPTWNPFVIELKGPLHKGARLAIRVRQGNGRDMRFTPEVTQFEAGTLFEWRGQLLHRALFSGEHRLRVEPLGTDGCRFEHSERFTGVLVPLLKRSLQATEPSFVAMNQALKARAEQMPAG